ncbi:hypothetical protein [Devosia submarina]|uniref:hypothetical protein n=1 Tax=Devosia submarina TaxID=1173082 RepID=UPI001300272A|nr:hypothetical protein [Devosia submarina]
MIPASYLYRGYYHQHWEQEAGPVQGAQQAPQSGHLIIVHRLLKFLLHRIGAHRHSLGVHAYD